ERMQKPDHPGAIGRAGQSIDAARSGAPMRHVIENFIQRVRRSIMEKGLGKGKDGEQRWRNEPVRSQRRPGVLANLVERRGVERAYVSQFAKQFSARVHQTGTR